MSANRNTDGAGRACRFLPPRLAELLRTLGVSVRRPVQGPHAGLHRSPHFGSSVEFAEYREYTPGDPTNLIDWAVYARSDRIMIRRFQEETNLRAYVMLDTSGSLAFRDEGCMSKMEYACHLCAGLMFVLLNQGDAAGLFLFDRRIHRSFAPAATFEELRPLLLELESVQPAGEGDIEAALHDAAGLIRARSLVVVISDLLQEPERVSRGLRHLAHDGHNLMVLQVLDPGERRLAFTGVTELRDLETGRRLALDADDIRDAYRGAVERYLTELRGGLAECLAAYHLIDTRRPVEEQLAHLQAPARP